MTTFSHYQLQILAAAGTRSREDDVDHKAQVGEGGRQCGSADTSNELLFICNQLAVS